MILFYLLLVLDSFLLQLPRCLLGFVLRFCWHPPKRATLPKARPLAELKTIAEERRPTLDRETYGQGGDSAKFCGMLAYSTEDEQEWKNVMGFVCDDGSLKRNLKEPSEEDSVPFSGDMLSGFLLAVVGRLPKLTEDERAKLAKVWNRTTWEGFPLLFAHPLYGKKVFDRGHVWRPWWLFGSEDILTALAWLYAGWKITGETRYKVAYYAFMILQGPSLLITCPDGQFWLGRVYGIATYNTHSKALVFFSGWLMNESFFFTSALKQAYKRHSEYNADIAVLAGQATDAEGWEERALPLISSAVDKGRYPCPQDKKYLSLIWPPELVMRASEIVPPEYRGGDYIWERNPIKGDVLDDRYRAMKGLDVIFPIGVIEKPPL